MVARKPTPESTTASLPAALVSQLDAAAQSSFKEAAAPGAIAGVRTPEGTWIKAYGLADPTTNAPMTTDMHTRIGSVTKTFTGTLIMQLAEQDKLSLDETIDKYVPGIPNGNRVTLRTLADMTTGVASYTQSTKFTDPYFSKPETIFKPDQLIGIGVSESPIFAPGEKFNYSNTNTMLLGKVVEKVTGEPVADAFEKQIFGPLELADTKNDTSVVVQTNSDIAPGTCPDSPTLPRRPCAPRPRHGCSSPSRPRSGTRSPRTRNGDHLSGTPGDGGINKRGNIDTLRRDLDHLPVQAIVGTGDRGVHDRSHRAPDPRDSVGGPGARAAAGVGSADGRGARC